MTTRKKHGVKTKLAAMARQATCPLCGQKLGALDGLDWDHIVPLALGGADDETNLVAVHRPCHRLKTSGNGHTSHGSDIHAIAKTRRLTKDTEEFKRRLMAKGEGEQRPQSKWPTRKLQSRNTFQERT